MRTETIIKKYSFTCSECGRETGAVYEEDGYPLDWKNVDGKDLCDNHGHHFCVFCEKETEEGERYCDLECELKELQC